MITDLPSEIFIELLTNVDWRTLIRCTTVCKAWKHIILETASLQYIIELGANHIVDNTSLKELQVSSSVKLDLLLERLTAWRHLNWTKVIDIDTPGSCKAYEFVGGVFAKAGNLEDDPNSTEWTRLAFYTLPSKTRPGEVKIIENVGMICRDFAIDPVQDLVALVEASRRNGISSTITVHLRTMSTNEQHPLARLPSLSFHVRAGEISPSGTHVQICHDVVALLFRVEGYSRLLIWQWQEGTLLVEEFSPAERPYVQDFDLISSRAYMIITRIAPAAIKLYRFNDTTTTEGSVKRAELVVTLRLPELHDDRNQFIAVTSHTAPFTASLLPDQAFGASDTGRLHIMYIRITTAERLENHPLWQGNIANFVMIVRNEAFLRYLKRYGALLDNNHLVASLPWESWGPQNSRWLEESLAVPWLRYVQGSRFIRSQRAQTADGARLLLRLMDFSVNPGRSNEPDGEVAPAANLGYFVRSRIIRKPSVIRDSSVFKKDVISELPYREVTRINTHPHQAFMIDDERIVALSWSEESGPTSLTIFLM